MSGGISTQNLLEQTRLLQQAARESGAILQAVVGDCGSSNFGHHMALQELLLKQPDGAIVPIFDQGHLLRNIVVNLRNGHEYTCGGILFLLLILNSNRQYLGARFSLLLIRNQMDLFRFLR